MSEPAAAAEPQATVSTGTAPVGGTDAAVSGGQNNGQDTTKPQLFTAEQVNQIVQERLARESRKAKPQEQAKEKNGKAGDPFEELRAKVEQLELENAFVKASAGAKLNDGQRDILERLFRTERPENPREWLQNMITALGLGPQESASKPEPQKASTQTAPQKLPHDVLATAASAPSPRSQADMVTDPNQLTKDDVARLGAAKVREIFQAWRQRNGGGSFLSRGTPQQG